MQIIKMDDGAVLKAVEVLEKGGLVVYPTETLYGIGVDATNESAVAKLTKYKNRPFGKPYSIAVLNQKMAEDYAELNTSAKELYSKFLPGPITVISKGRHRLARGIESETGDVGIRVPDYDFVRQITNKLGKPITATSANASYKKRPYSVDDILQNISSSQKGLIDLIVDAGELPKHEPSTVIDTTPDDLVILRQGEIKLSDKNEVLSRSPESTQNVAKEIWQKYESFNGKRSIIFALQGEMGAGKTIFTKGLAKAMGITELVTSPTFSLENEYETGRKKLFHFDAWRMEKPDDLRSLDFDNLINEKRIIAIEWAEKVGDVIREFDDEAIVLWINISYGDKENDRVISWGVEK